MSTSSTLAADSVELNQNCQRYSAFFSLLEQFLLLWDTEKEIERNMGLHINNFIVEAEKIVSLTCAWTETQPNSHSNLQAALYGTTLAGVIRSQTVNQKIASNFASHISSLLLEFSHFTNPHNANILIETYFMAVEVATSVNTVLLLAER